HSYISHFNNSNFFAKNHIWLYATVLCYFEKIIFLLTLYLVCLIYNLQKATKLSLWATNVNKLAR
ncbi:MAG: hypothetical protein PHE67_14085, partial [Campylobacterales bacterium]|nr:hypothetical protein [Campylobacterales bacterium]